MGRLRAILLGNPSIYWDDQKMNFPFAKMEAMLYYLLVVGEATREKLATLFWGETDENAAKKNLRNTVYLIKKTLSPALLVTPTRTTIAINPQLIDSIDATQLDTMEIHAVLEHSPGVFLDGFSCKNTAAFEEWVLGEREQFKEKIISRLTKSIIQRIHDKNYAAAKQSIKQLIQLDEYNESAYRLLMKIHEREEAFYKVLEIYHDLESKLATELNLQPSSRTQEIYHRVQEKRIVTAPVSEPGNKECFFGRTAELQVLRLAVDQFCLNRPARQMLLIQGEQGVGKTSIVGKLFKTIPGGNCSVLQTQCYQAESGYDYKAWSQIFIQVKDLLLQDRISLPPLWYKVISYLFPALEIDDALTEQDPVLVAYEFNQTMIEEIMCAVLGKLSKQRRLLIVIDDIHWMDNRSLAVLHQVLRLHGTGIFCMAICHSEYLSQIEKALWDFERDDMIEKLLIERFNFDTLVEILETKLPAARTDVVLQHKLFDYTGGNALFLMECLHLLAAGQELGSGSLRLQNVLKERLGNLSDNARKILEAASVFFKYSTYHELLAITRMDEFDLVEAIEELERKNLLTKTDRIVHPSLVYVFYNLQIQSFVYYQMSLPRQKLLHKLVGLELERQIGSGLQTKDIYEAILYHYTAADEKIKVLEYTVRLAEKYFCPQYELFPELNDGYPAGHSGFGESRHQTLVYLEKIRELLTFLAAEMADDGPVALYQSAYWEMMGRYYIWRGEHGAGIKMIHQLLRLASARGFQDYLVKGFQEMIFWGIQVSRPSIIKNFAEKLQQAAELADLPGKKAAAIRYLGVAAELSGQAAAAEQYYRQSIVLFKKMDMRNSCYILNIAAAYNYIGNLRRDTLQLAEALHYYEQAVRIAGHKRISEGVAVFYINAGHTAFKLGLNDKARQYLSEALAVGDGFGDYRGYWCSRSYCTLYCVLATLAVREERYHEGRMYLNKADEFLDRYHDQAQTGLVLRTKTEIRRIMDNNPVAANILGDYLTLPTSEYEQQAQSILTKSGGTGGRKSDDAPRSEFS
ncbi:MAG TPA: AAA family ATPase [Patescibacteria group bacterium]|nr:AAA family ATPase [Patescibacteria group bacterium]